MGKPVTNVKFRVHNFEHAKLICHRAQSLNASYIGENWEPLTQPSYEAPFLWVDEKGYIFWGGTEAEHSFEKLEAKEMTLEDLYEIPNVKHFELNNEGDQTTVNLDEKRLIINGVKINFSELNRLNNLLNDSK